LNTYHGIESRIGYNAGFLLCKKESPLRLIRHEAGMCGVSVSRRLGLAFGGDRDFERLQARRDLRELHELALSKQNARCFHPLQHDPGERLFLQEHGGDVRPPGHVVQLFRRPRVDVLELDVVTGVQLTERDYDLVRDRRGRRPNAEDDRLTDGGLVQGWQDQDFMRGPDLLEELQLFRHSFADGLDEISELGENEAVHAHVGDELGSDGCLDCFSASPIDRSLIHESLLKAMVGSPYPGVGKAE
jgi:hypothetical protein